MKKLFFILITLLCFAKTTKADVCSYLDYNPTIKINYSYGKLNYNFNRNQAEITKIAQQYGIMERGVFANGLAVVNVNWEITINTLSELLTDTDICVFPSEINVFIGYENPMIYISKDLEPNSCEFNVVLRHEQTHQQINKKSLELFLPKLEQKIIETIKSISPKYVTNIKQIDIATNIITKDYNQKLKPIVTQFKQTLLAQQSALDSKSNYAYESGICQKPTEPDNYVEYEQQ